MLKIYSMIRTLNFNVPIGINKIPVNLKQITPEWIGEMCKLGLMTNDVIEDLDKYKEGRDALIRYENKTWKERKLFDKNMGETIAIKGKDKEGKDVEKIGTVLHALTDKMTKNAKKEKLSLNENQRKSLKNLQVKVL